MEENSEDEEAQLDEKLAELKEEEQKALKRWGKVVYMALHGGVISVRLNHIRCSASSWNWYQTSKCSVYV